jgi:acyl carrier protein
MNDILIEHIKQDILHGRTDVQISPDDDLLGTGIVDSIGMLRIIEFIESRFGVSISLEDVTIENFGSVEAMTAYLKRRGVGE